MTFWNKFKKTKQTNEVQNTTEGEISNPKSTNEYNNQPKITNEGGEGQIDNPEGFEPQNTHNNTPKYPKNTNEMKLQHTTNPQINEIIPNDVWSKTQKIISQKGNKKRVLVEWNIVTSDNTPHTVVLQHTQDNKSSKTRRMLWVDGKEKYNNRSTASSFRVEIDKDVIVVTIEYNNSNGQISYKCTINGLEYNEAYNLWKKAFHGKSNTIGNNTNGNNTNGNKTEGNINNTNVSYTKRGNTNVGFSHGWNKKSKVISQKGNKKRILVEFEFITSDNIPHSIVLQHTQDGKSNKTRRMFWLDGVEKYNKKSSASLYRFEVDKDIVVITIDVHKLAMVGQYEYKCVINGMSFEEAFQNWKNRNGF